MSFIEKNLSTNEKIIYKGGIHWYVYIRGIFLVILGGSLSGASNTAGSVLILAGFISLVLAITISSSSEFAITNKRIILKTGVLSRKFIELQLNKSEGLQIEQGLMGRIFNYGTIKITTAGVTEKYGFLRKPFEFKKQVNNAVEASFSNLNMVN
eukprot:gene797-801_t